MERQKNRTGFQLKITPGSFGVTGASGLHQGQCHIAKVSKTGAFQNEWINRYRDRIHFHYSAFPCWAEYMGLVMKPATEQDRIAARALAKNLIKQFEGMGLQRTGNSQDLIERACSLLRKEAANNGISPTVLKWYVSAVRTGEI